MTRNHWIVVIALGAVAIAGVLVIGLRAASETAGSADATAADPVVASLDPFPAPAVAGSTITGTEASLADYAGQPVVLNFWASWCDPCRREIPALKAFAQKHPDIAVLGVNYQDDRGSANDFALEQDIPWPSVEDDGPIAADYRVPGLPATFFIDANGQVVDRILGEATEQMLDQRVSLLRSGAR